MFIAPVNIMVERHKESVQTYLLSETIYFVDNMRNTGVLTKDMYGKYADTVYSAFPGINIDMMIVKDELTNTFHNEQIFDEMSKTGEYSLERNDYVRVCIHDDKNEVAVFYGGMIKQ